MAGVSTSVPPQSVLRLFRYEARLVAASDVLVISRSNIKVLWASVTVALMLVRHLANSLLALPRLSESEKGDQQWYSENLEHVDNGTECYTSNRPTLS